MASIKINVSLGGYSSFGSKGDSGSISIDVPLPDRGVLGDYLAMVESTFDKTGDLVESVRGDVVDAEVVDEGAEVSA